MNFLDALKLALPLVLGATGKGTKFIPIIAEGMKLAEDSGKKGIGKKRLAISAVRVIAAIGNEKMEGREKINLDEIGEIAGQIIDPVVKLVNELKSEPEPEVK